MKAIVVREFGGPEVMKLEDVPVPAPGPGQLLVRVGAVGVNPVDGYIRSGTLRPQAHAALHAGHRHRRARWSRSAPASPASRPAPASTPTTPSAATRSSRCARNGRRTRCRSAISFAQGAALGVPYATAWRALFIRARARAGETVLVHGASGGVGTAAVQIARAHGLQVIGTAGTADGLALARAQGAHHVLNHRDADYLQQVRPLTGGRGVDVVLEMLANVNLDKDLEVLARNGRVVGDRQPRPGRDRPAQDHGRGRRHPRHDAVQCRPRRVPRNPLRHRRRTRERHADPVVARRCRLRDAVAVARRGDGTGRDGQDRPGAVAAAAAGADRPQARRPACARGFAGQRRRRRARISTPSAPSPSSVRVAGSGTSGTSPSVSTGPSVVVSPLVKRVVTVPVVVCRRSCPGRRACVTSRRGGVSGRRTGRAGQRRAAGRRVPSSFRTSGPPGGTNTHTTTPRAAAERGHGRAAGSGRRVGAGEEPAAGTKPGRPARKPTSRSDVASCGRRGQPAAPRLQKWDVSQAAGIRARLGHRTRVTGLNRVQRADGGLIGRHGQPCVIRHPVAAAGADLGRAVGEEGFARRQLHWPLRPIHVVAAAIRDVHGARGGHRDRPHPLDVNRLVVGRHHVVATYGRRNVLLRIGAARHDRVAIDRTRGTGDGHRFDGRGSRGPERLSHRGGDFGAIWPGGPHHRADERAEPECKATKRQAQVAAGGGR